LRYAVIMERIHAEAPASFRSYGSASICIREQQLRRLLEKPMPTSKHVWS
jgi:hypothetical protein